MSAQLNTEGRFWTAILNSSLSTTIKTREKITVVHTDHIHLFEYIQYMSTCMQTMYDHLLKIKIEFVPTLLLLKLD